MARFENCTIEQYVEHMTVERMEVGSMMVEHAEIQSQGQSQGQTFDIDSIPAEYFDFFRWVNIKEARREVVEMRSELAREVERYDDIKHRKTPLMLSVIEPLVLKDRLKHVPTHPVLEALFGDVIDGYSRQAHTNFREELSRKHIKFRPKRKA